MKIYSGGWDGQNMENIHGSQGTLFRGRVNPCYLTHSSVIMGISNNKLRKMVNGNRRDGNTALILHWNSGSAYMKTKWNILEI